jgi:tetratricopeptide (TPR) repeat protein
MLVLGSVTASAQAFGNTISGRVVGVDRRPVSDLRVELLDDLSRTIAYAKTNASGFYTFTGMGSGRFIVRVLSLGTEYEEQENTVEIINVTTFSGSGTQRTGGFANEQSDFNLKLRKGAILPPPTAVFVQEVPPDAQSLYDKALADLEAKRRVEGTKKLKEAVEIFPRYYAALERLGMEYLRMGEPHADRAAEIVFGAAVEVNARGYKSWYGLAYSQFSQNDFSKALKAAEKAVEINPNSADALLLFGVLLRHNKQFVESEKQLLRANELSHETMPQVHWELALLYGNHLSRFSEAARELKLFLKGRPDARDTENIRKKIAEFELKAKP